MARYKAKSQPHVVIQSSMHPACPVCQNSVYKRRRTLRDTEGFASRHFQIAACNHCGVQVSLPFLNDAELAPWYYESYHGSRRMGTLHPFSLAMQFFMAIRILRIKPYLRQGVTVIDYGAGNGLFVKALAHRGVNAFGVENSTFQAIDDCCQPIRGTVLSSFNRLEHFNIMPDIVTLWHVIEHLSDPRSDLCAIHAALPENGIIVVAMPNIQSGQAKITGSNWYHLDPPRHRWHFSDKDLSRLLRSSGFEIISRKHFDMEFAPIGWWQSLLNCIHFSRGFPLSYLKRGGCQIYNLPSLAIVADAVSSVLAGGALLPLAFLFSLIEAACAKGGSPMVIGRKISQNDD